MVSKFSEGKLAFLTKSAVANFEGDPIKLDVGSILNIDLEEWEIAIATPNLEVSDLTKLNLGNGQGLLLTRLSAT